MSWADPDTKTYICSRCYRERPITDTPLKSQGEHTNMTYLFCGDCQKAMMPHCTCNASYGQSHAVGCMLYGEAP